MTDAQLTRLDERATELMNEHHPRPAIESELTVTDWAHVDFRPTRDANAAAELRKAMADVGRAFVTLLTDGVYSHCSVKRRKTIDVVSDGKADNENLATVRCYVRFRGGDPNEVMGEV